MKKHLFILSLAAAALSACGSASTWDVSYHEEHHGVDIRHGAQLMFTGVYATYRLDGKLVGTRDYPTHEVSTGKVSDAFGNGRAVTIRHSGNSLPVLTQSFYIYPDKDFLLTDFTLEAAPEQGNISTNYMAPLNIEGLDDVWTSAEARALFVPFDNDCWIRYRSCPLSFASLTSYEVSAIFDNTSRNGVVVGSVEHDTWKTGIVMQGNERGGLRSLTCAGGIADSLTRDVKPHGAVSGLVVKSPKVMLGVFADWRNGMDAFGEANATVAPRRAWSKAVPFGWNSWGALQFKLRYHHAMEVSNFFHSKLGAFKNADGLVYIGLDSGWDRFTKDELKSFVAECIKNGQVPCIYWTPFTDWGKQPERAVQGAEQYKYKDVYVYADGKPQILDGAYAIDPTHPAIEERMKKQSEYFRECGFKYVKVDFMTHGAMEGDGWYRKEIQTGMQAYNYGMQLLDKYFHDMYLNLSIAPLFPAQYAQSRRIACDAWNKIKDTEYTLNALSYGWWLNKVYHYNDADHVVLRDATEGENRARITSAAITGLFIIGDDFSDSGDSIAKARAVALLTNPDINAMATGISFRPLEGNGERSESNFVRTDKTCTYYACFNYTETPISITVPVARIGGHVSEKSAATNLWEHASVDLSKPVTVPGKDVLVLRIENEK